MMSNRGIALVSVIFIALMTFLAVGGLYLLLKRLFESSETVKIYSSVRDAAKGGVEHAILRIINGDVSPNYCCRPGEDCSTKGLEMQYRLASSGNVYITKIYICYVGQASGYGISGTAYLGTPGTAEAGAVYRIISEAYGDRNTYARVEAFYIK